VELAGVDVLVVVTVLLHGWSGDDGAGAAAAAGIDEGAASTASEALDGEL